MSSLPHPPALKRSFEVEETESSTHPSPLSRRTNNPLRSSTSSTSSHRSYDLSSRNSDLSSSSSRSSPSESSNPRSPSTGMRRAESSRRTEMSIEVSSKQIDNSPSAGIARFGLKRPEVSLSSRSSPVDSSSNSLPVSRRAELGATRTAEPPAPPRRVDTTQLSSVATSRIPEPGRGRAAEPPSQSFSQVDGAARRPELPVLENNSHPPPVPTAPLPVLAEPRVERVQSPVAEVPTVAAANNSKWHLSHLLLVLTV